jgi:rubrerythrin
MSTATMTGTDNQLALLFQYTVEAYKTFEKLAETLPNPMAAATFKNFAIEERHFRDLLEIKYLAGSSRIKLTLGPDLRFQDMLEGDLSPREIIEFLIVRERTIEQKLAEWAKSSESDANLYRYIGAGKRAHLAYLERELAMTRLYSDWFRREDGETLIVHGKPE